MARVERNPKHSAAARLVAGRGAAGGRTSGGSRRGFEPIYQIVPVALIVLVTLLAFATYIAWREAVEPALCRRAEGQVYAEHPALFDSLRSSAHMSMRCVPPDFLTSVRVEVDWPAAGGTFLATYKVPLFGPPRADDVGARSIDKVAPLGSRAVASLTGR